nr:ribonuclease H-like domain-containing protein [Tanacetum cinerariifolium]
MFDVVDISELTLTVRHPNGTLTKITHVGNLKLNKNVVLFDVLVVPEYCVSLLFVHKLIKDSKLSVSFDETTCYIQYLKRENVLGTSCESDALYLFDKECDKSIVSCNSKFFVCHVSKDVSHNRDAFPLSEHKSIVFGELIHLDVWGPYKVVSREGFRDVKFYETVLPYKMNTNESVNESSKISTTYFLDHYEFEPITNNPLSLNDHEEGTPDRDGRVHHREVGANTDQAGYDKVHSVTPIGEQNQYEGNVGQNLKVLVFQNDLLNIVEEVGPRRSQRSSKLPAKLNDFLLDSKVKYGLNRYANRSVLSPKNYCFVSN